MTAKEAKKLKVGTPVRWMGRGAECDGTVAIKGYNRVQIDWADETTTCLHIDDCGFLELRQSD